MLPFGYQLFHVDNDHSSFRSFQKWNTVSLIKLERGQGCIIELKSLQKLSFDTVHSDDRSFTKCSSLVIECRDLCALKRLALQCVKSLFFPKFFCPNIRDFTCRSGYPCRLSCRNGSVGIDCLPKRVYGIPQGKLHLLHHMFPLVDSLTNRLDLTEESHVSQFLSGELLQFRHSSLGLFEA